MHFAWPWNMRRTSCRRKTIAVFIHHNTLHAFEHEPFEQGVRRGGRTFGGQPFLNEDRYREALGRGRIARTSYAPF